MPIRPYTENFQPSGEESKPYVTLLVQSSSDILKHMKLGAQKGRSYAYVKMEKEAAARVHKVVLNVG